MRRLVLVAGWVWGWLWVGVRGGARALRGVVSWPWRANARTLVFAGCFFLFSGFLRSVLGLDGPLRNGLVAALAFVRAALQFMDVPPWLVAILLWFVLIVAVSAVGIAVTVLAMRLPNFLPSIVMCCVGLQGGRMFTSRLELTAILSLPVMVAFTVSWTGVGSLLALGHSMFVHWYLQVAVHPWRLQFANERHGALQTSLSSGMVSDADHGHAYPHGEVHPDVDLAHSVQHGLAGPHDLGGHGHDLHGGHHGVDGHHHS